MRGSTRLRITRNLGVQERYGLPPQNGATKIQWRATHGRVQGERKEQLQSSTEDLLRNLQKHDFGHIRSRFAWPLRWLLSSAKLAKAMRPHTSRLGSIESFARPTVDDSGPFANTKTLVHFARGNLGLQLTFNGANKLLGMTLGAPIKLGLVSTWQVPAYVEPTAFEEVRTSVSMWPWPAVQGTLSVPKREGPHPAVLMLTGSGDGDRDISIGAIKPFKDLADGLASKGIVALRLEKPLLKCGFKQTVTRTVTLHDEYIPHNVEGLKLLAGRKDVDPSRIFLLGISLGGRVAPRLCTHSPVKLAGMIVMAGSSRDLLDTIKYQMEWAQARFPKNEEEFQSESAALEQLAAVVKGPGVTRWSRNPTAGTTVTFPLSYLLDDMAHDPVAIAQGLKELRMLFLQGTDDFQVPAEHDFVRWKEGLRAEERDGRATFKLYEGVNHPFIKYKGAAQGLKQYDEQGHMDEQVVEDIATWIGEEPLKSV